MTDQPQAVVAAGLFAHAAGRRGERPGGADAWIDANYRLRRIYYHQLPAGRQGIRLGRAVAASACVPGLFEPLSLRGLYPEKGPLISVRLVDAGVHDNLTEHVLQAGALGFPLPVAPREPWSFLGIEPHLKQPGRNTPLMRHLKVADRPAFKLWLLSRSLQLAGGMMLLALLLWLLAQGWRHWTTTAFSLTVGGLLTAVLCLVLGVAGWAPLAKATQYRKTLQSILIGIGMGTVGWLLARLHLHLFDRLFLRLGRLKRLAPPA